MGRRIEALACSSALMLALFLAGCPKRPDTASAPSAPAPAVSPAPTPKAGTTPGAGVTAKAGAADALGAPSAPGPVAAAPRTPTTPAAPKEFRPIEALKDIHFDFDKYDIRPGDGKILDEHAKWLKANSNYVILIEGHADERGTNEYNLALGERRAKSAMNYLIAQGVQAKRVTIISYGEEGPLCAEKNEECWAKNRRAHFLIKG